jgi:hypothetical protein
MIRTFAQSGSATIFCRGLSGARDIDGWSSFSCDEPSSPSIAGSELSLKSSFITKETSVTFARGQAVLEYVLLLTVALVIGLILTRNLVGTAAEPAGIRSAWVSLIQTIGLDLPDK